MAALFWMSLGTLLYIYLGYPLAVWALARAFGREPDRQDGMPSVSLLIPALNEEAHLGEKLRNSLALAYPADRLEIVVASDGSTDRTNAIAESFAPRGVRLIAMERNLGKSAMLGRVVPQLRGEITVFSDASSELDAQALRVLTQSFADPRVGCVSGLYRLKGDARGEGEGLYWRYETFIKRQEGRLHSILGAHGAFYAIRRALFEAPGATAINDDYLIPMRIVARGFRAVYEPRALAWERELASVEGEFARRRRIAAGNCQQVVTLRGMLNPFRHGWVALCFFSHKVLRTLAPLLLITTFVASWWLEPTQAAVFLTLQGLFYASAWAGHLCQRRGVAVRWLSPALYFCLGNLAMLAGLVAFCSSGRKPLVWERTR